MMSDSCAQYVEPEELRALRHGIATNLSSLEMAEFSLEVALRSIRMARQRAVQMDAWVKAVDLQIEQEPSR